jgi:hypothetical protein
MDDKNNNRRWLPGRVAQSCALLLLTEEFDLDLLRNHCVSSSVLVSKNSPIILDSFELSAGISFDRSLKHFLRKLKAWFPEDLAEEDLRRIVFVYTSESTECYLIMNEERRLPRFVVGDDQPTLNTDHIVLEGSLIWHFVWFLIKISRRTVHFLLDNDEEDFVDEEITQLFHMISK